jgi:CBS domain-containing protein
MPNSFNFSESPFDCLTSAEQRLVRDSVDTVYFPKGETILEVGAQPTHLFVVIKGLVLQFDNHEVVHTYGVNDCFDGRGLVAERVSSRFVAGEEVVAYQLAKKAVSSLIASNATFGALLFSDLSDKLSTVAQRGGRHELQSLSVARVDEAFVRPPHFVDADADIVSVVRLFLGERTTSALVLDTGRQPHRLGIFTHTGLQRAIVDGTPLDRLRVGDLANYSLITVKPSTQLGDALALMIRRRVHRVVVSDATDGTAVTRDNVVGVLEALDVFSFLSNQSYLINIQIIEADSIAALGRAAAQVNRLITLLHQGGTRVGLIATLVQELNARLFERTWQLIAPADLVANSCLYVMGSEGRGEQLLKTDQDNGLILRDGYSPPGNLAELCEQFSAALRDYGYPDCPGGIMISNPVWRQTASAFGELTRQWLVMPTPESLMFLAIFIDAHTVSGDPGLLQTVRNDVFSLVVDNDSLLARFASAINTFEDTSGWWNRLLQIGNQRSDSLDIKKAGIFPLVHGVRSLAFQHRLEERGTVERMQRLVALDVLPADLEADLAQSLHFFMDLRLRAGLGEMALGQPVSGTVQVDRLGSLDRDLLKDTLAVVKRFRHFLRQHFRLDMIS